MFVGSILNRAAYLPWLDEGVRIRQLKMRSVHLCLLLSQGNGSLPSTPQEQRRAELWRRMKLEFEMQGLLIGTTTLVQEWQRLHGSKEAVGNEVSKIASHILLTGFVGLQQERTVWLHSYERDDIA